MSFFDFLKDVPIVGPIISTVGNLASTRQANSAQDARQEDAQRFNAQEAALARQYNAEQAEIARNYNSAEAVKARDFNAQQTTVNRDWAGWQAANQMEFQRQMSNTQYQRAMSDMRTAGLNPILAYSQGGAGTPSGAAGSSSAASSSAASAAAASGPAASSPGPQQVQRMPIGDLLASAMQLAQIENVQAQTGKTKAETQVVESDIVDKGKPDSYFEPKTYSARERNMRASLLNEEAMKAREGMYLTIAQKELVDEEIKNAVKQGRRIEADTRDTNANAVLRELAASEAKAGSDYWKKYPETYGISQGLKITGETLNSALGFKRIFAH